MANSQMGLLGRKLGMTQIFDATGNVAGVTVLEVQPNTVVQIKTSETKVGYAALQLGYGTRKEQRVTKAEFGHAKAAGATVPFHTIKEIRVPEAEAAKHARGSQITVADIFVANEKVDVRGTSKGKGTAGVMKRHNFKGFKRSHGVHEYYRHGGSIGTRLTPGMTFKGVKMPGRMGNAWTTVQNLKIVKIDAERGLIYVRGGVPGPQGASIIVRKAVK